MRIDTCVCMLCTNLRLSTCIRHQIVFIANNYKTEITMVKALQNLISHRTTILQINRKEREKFQNRKQQCIRIFENGNEKAYKWKQNLCKNETAQRDDVSNRNKDENRIQTTYFSDDCSLFLVSAFEPFFRFHDLARFCGQNKCQCKMTIEFDFFLFTRPKKRIVHSFCVCARCFAVVMINFFVCTEIDSLKTRNTIDKARKIHAKFTTNSMFRWQQQIDRFMPQMNERGKLKIHSFEFKCHRLCMIDVKEPHIKCSFCVGQAFGANICKMSAFNKIEGANDLLMLTLHFIYSGYVSVCVCVSWPLCFFIHTNPQYIYSLLVFHVILAYIVALT